MSEISSVSPDLILLHSLEDFQQHALKLLSETRRHIAILSRHLDENIYATAEFATLLSSFARSSRHADIKILVKNTKPLIESRHQLVTLHQRLPSKIALRQVTIEPENSDMGFMLCDTRALLYQNDESTYRGFANTNAAAEVKRLREIFEYTWQHGDSVPELQVLRI
jgi:hypothetical protein